MVTKILGRDDLLTPRNLRRELVEVPELNGSLYLRELSTSQLLAFNARVDELRDEKEHINPENSIKLMTLVLSFSACDEDGALLLTEQDAAALMDSKIDMLTRLSTKAFELSGMDLGIGEVTANLKKAPPSSSSDLPTNSRKRKRK